MNQKTSSAGTNQKKNQKQGVAKATHTSGFKFKKQWMFGALDGDTDSCIVSHSQYGTWTFL